MARPKPNTPPSVSRGLRLPVELDKRVTKRMRTLRVSRNEYFRTLAADDIARTEMAASKTITA